MIELSYHACFILAFIALVLALVSVVVGFLLGIAMMRHLPCEQLQDYMLKLHDAHKQAKHPGRHCEHIAFKDNNHA